MNFPLLKIPVITGWTSANPCDPAMNCYGRNVTLKIIYRAAVAAELYVPAEGKLDEG